MSTGPLSSLRDRKLFQWALGYAAGAWVLLQVVDVLAGLWGWPPVVGRLVFVALAAGFGLTLVLSWFHGEKGRQRVSPLEAALLAILVLAGGVGVVAVARSSDMGGEGLPSGGGPASAAGPAATTLAVLPFRDLSPGGGRGYLGDGIAETLISSLARLETLTVVARTSAFRFRDGDDVREIGRILGAGSVVEGTVTQVGGRVRVTASLVDAISGENLWADRFDDEVAEEDIFDLQDDVARRIVEALQVRLSGEARIVRGGSRSPEAQRAFFLGMHHWTLRTTEDVATATRLFNEAIAADSSFAEAWGGLALSYVLSTPQEYGVPGIGRFEALDRAEMAARRAIELDPDLPAAYTALGDAAVQRGDLDASERWYREAIARSGGYATAHHWLADLLMIRLDGEGALAELDIAETLDPVAPAILVERAEALMMLGRYEEAVAQMDKALALHPNAELIRSFDLYFSMKRGEWDRVAEQLRALGRIGGIEGQGDALASALADPEQRPGALRDLAAVMTEGVDPGELEARWGLRPGMGGLSVQLMANPEMRFLVVRELEGLEPALDLLAAMATGPDAAQIYPPVLPALIGPEHLDSRRVREVMQLMVSRD